MASTLIMSPSLFSTPTSLPSVPMPAPALPRVGSIVRVTTTLGGLTLEGQLAAVNLINGTLTLHTKRFQQPLSIQVANIGNIQELEAPHALSRVQVDASELQAAQAAREAAAGVERLASAARAVSLSPILSALAAPPGVKVPPVSPALSATSVASSGSSDAARAAAANSMFKGTSAAFVPSSVRSASPPRVAVSAPVSAPVAMPMPAMYRTTSAPVATAVPAYSRVRFQQPQMGSMLPPPGMAAQPAHLVRSMSANARAQSMGGAMPAMSAASVVPPALVAPVRPSPPRVQQPLPQQQLVRDRSVSPARSTASTGSHSSASSGSSARSSSDNPKMLEVCKYFNTPKGCSRGSACRYRHAALPGVAAPASAGTPAAKSKSNAQPSGSRRSRRRQSRRSRANH